MNGRRYRQASKKKAVRAKSVGTELKMPNGMLPNTQRKQSESNFVIVCHPIFRAERRLIQAGAGLRLSDFTRPSTLSCFSRSVVSFLLAAERAVCFAWHEPLPP